jgi:hypothetical protein
LRHPYLRGDPSGDVDIEIAVDGLRFVGEGGSTRAISFSEVREVRLFCTTPGSMWLPSILPPRALAYCCALKLADKKRIVLTNLFQEAGDWISYGRSYRAFIMSLHDHLRRTVTGVRYRAGVTWPALLFSSTWIGVALAKRQEEGRSSLLNPIFAPERLINLPRRYRPDDLPQRFLPPDRDHIVIESR